MIFLTAFKLKIMEGIEENNKLIAEFMGCEAAFAHEVDEHGYTQTVDGYKFVYGKDFVLAIPVSKLQYHTSYDWLIPVMQKIFMTATAMPKEYYNVTHTYAITPIDDMHLIVVSFIKWYNENN